MRIRSRLWNARSWNDWGTWRRSRTGGGVKERPLELWLVPGRRNACARWRGLIGSRKRGRLSSCVVMSWRRCERSD